MLTKHRRNIELLVKNASYVNEYGRQGHIAFLSAMCIKHNESAMIAPLLGMIKGSGIPLLSTGTVSLVVVMEMMKYTAMAQAVVYQVSVFLLLILMMSSITVLQSRFPN